MDNRRLARKVWPMEGLRRPGFHFVHPRLFHDMFHNPAMVTGYSRFMTCSRRWRASGYYRGPL